MEGPTGFTLEEFEAAAGSPTAPKDAADVKADAEGLPSEIQGKSLKEIADMFNSMKSAVAISESARLASTAAAEARRSADSVRTPVTPAAEPEITREQLQELYDKDPLAAFAAIVNLNNRELGQHFDKRLGALAGAGTAQAQNAAQTKYALEFELFGDEIKDFVGSLQDKSALATEEGWKNIISYVRGKDGNLEKYIDARTKGSTVVNRETARTSQRNEAPTNFTSTHTASAAPTGLDEVQVQIADEYIKSGIVKDYDEYKRWMKQS